jgi:hypothetical protein
MRTGDRNGCRLKQRAHLTSRTRLLELGEGEETVTKRIIILVALTLFLSGSVGQGEWKIRVLRDGVVDVFALAEVDSLTFYDDTTGPAELPDLELWLRSDAGITYDEHGVSEWADQSGHSNNGVQDEQNRRPTFVCCGIGEKPVVRFDGTDDYLAIQNLRYLGIGLIDEITVCALVRSESQNPQMLISFDRDRYWHLALKSDAGENVGWDTRAPGGVTHNLRSPNACTDGQWHLIIAWFKAGEDPDKRIFIDEVDVASANGHAGYSLGIGMTRYGHVGVGSRTTVFGTPEIFPDWYLQGDLVELLIYHHALTEGERQHLEAYFVGRYGL